jgi:hypothetical protein
MWCTRRSWGSSPLPELSSAGRARARFSAQFDVPGVRHVPNPGEDVEEGDDFAGVVAALVAETQQSEIRENSFAPPEGFEPSHTV